MALTAYITSTRRLLRDANAAFWQNNELTDYINEGRLRIVSDTACTRVLLTTVNITQAVEFYPYNTVTNISISGYSVAGTTLTVTFSTACPFLRGFTINITGVTTPSTLNGDWGLATVATNALSATITLTAAQAAAMTGTYAGAGVASLNILNVLDIYVYFNSLRGALDRMSFSAMSRRFRPYVGFQDYPKAFAVYGQGVYIAPLPFQNLTTDWDVLPYPAALVSDSTYEAIPTAFQYAVPFYAAHRAYLSEQDEDKAEKALQQYKLQAAMAAKSQLTRGIAHGTFR